jgi:hypothetical protein
MSDGSHDAALFAFNDNAEVKLAHIGRRGIAVTMIDNVLHDPEGVAALGFAQPQQSLPWFARSSARKLLNRVARLGHADPPA